MVLVRNDGGVGRSDDGRGGDGGDLRWSRNEVEEGALVQDWVPASEWCGGLFRYGGGGDGGMGGVRHKSSLFRT